MHRNVDNWIYCDKDHKEEVSICFVKLRYYISANCGYEISTDKFKEAVDKIRLYLLR